MKATIGRCKGKGYEGKVKIIQHIKILSDAQLLQRRERETMNTLAKIMKPRLEIL